MNKMKTLAGETALYGLGSIIPRMLNFFLVALHTRIFLPAEYGIYINLYAWVAFLNVIYLFGMETTYFRFATKEGADEQTIFRITQTFVLTISVVLSLIIIIFSVPIAQKFSLPGRNDFLVWLAVLMLVDAAISIPFARLRLQKKAGKFAIAKLVNVIIQVGLNLYFLLFAFDPSIGIGYVLLANLIANLFYLLFFFKTLTSWRPAWDQKLFTSMFPYAFPVMLTGLAGMTNEMFSRTTLERWLPENFYPGKSSEYALGVFGACFRYSVIMSLAVQAFRFAAEPFFFSNANNKNSPALFAKAHHYFTIVCCFILLAVVINLDILKYILDAAYWEGLSIVPILLIGYMFLGMYYNFSVWFKLTDKTFYGTLITAGGAMLTIALNFLFIPRFGYVGSSWATLLCYLTMAISCYGLGQRYFPIPYRVLPGLSYLLFALLLIQLSQLLIIPNFLLSIVFHFSLMLFFVFVAYWREKKYWDSPVD